MCKFVNMKKIVLMVLAAGMAVAVQAQFKLSANETSEKMMYAQYMQVTNNGTNATVEHMTWKGMAIDGTLKGMKQKMLNKNYKHTSQQKSVMLFQGEFAGQEDCNIYIAGKGSKVYMVGVMLTPLQKPIESQALYAQMVELIKSKYGKESYQISEEQYLTSWVREKGTIELSIETEGAMSYVLLCYFDNVNYHISYDASKILKDL